MSRTRFSFSRGVINAVYSVVFWIILPNLILQQLALLYPALSLGAVRTLSITSIGVFIAVIAFCRGAFPKNSVVWALAGIASSLFSAAYIYFLLGTPADYTVGPGLTITLDISLIAILMAAVIALNSLSNIVELQKARKVVTERKRLQSTEVGA
ncbi:MAG: hypothetical protein WED05_13440 [Candidatus Atabeyarchaeum deiterrae]